MTATPERSRPEAAGVPPRLWLADYAEPTVRGGPEVLARQLDDLSQTAAWWPQGFTVLDLPGGEAGLGRALAGISDVLRQRVEAVGLAFPQHLSLGHYHRLPGLTDQAHAQIARWGFPLEALQLDEGALIDRVSACVRRRVRFHFIRHDPPIARICGLRIIRPGSADHNPFHRDGWLEMYHHSMNLWLPLLNCSAGSSLRVFPASHRWPENALERSVSGALLGGRRFSVPALIKLYRRAEPIEPLPQPGQGLAFSSFLLHGGGKNAHADLTRISAEIRFVAA